MKSMLLAAGWGPFIPFIIFFVFLTLSILQAVRKRSQRSGTDDGRSWERPSEFPEDATDSEGRAIVGRYLRPAQSPPATGTSFPPPPVIDAPRPLSPWEQELERVLRREPPSMPAPAPAVPAPSVAPAEWQAPNRGDTVEDLLTHDLESAPMPSTPLASFATAEAAYSDASNLAERARAFLQSADSKVDHAAPTLPPRRRMKSPELTAFLAGFRQPVTARHAIMAAVILGRPKAFEM
ncbi:MAG TPA: hypothetical protein PLX89_14165 [Verrucomicrobiota bacterium]|nr:hypothetical protein [Verrucomicrobiales bacterium]HRI14137.1 hypothetical protein [Verrucomicrobiota bacterium]